MISDSAAAKAGMECIIAPEAENAFVLFVLTPIRCRYFEVSVGVWAWDLQLAQRATD